MNSKKPLIAGIDPGSTSAVAAINLEGEEVLLESRREFSRHEIIESLVETGFPVVVTSDQREMPETVEKIASSFGARKFEPENNLSRSRKQKLGKGKNSHEKDAYASALHAYKSLKKTITKINRASDRGDSEKKEIAEEFIK